MIRTLLVFTAVCSFATAACAQGGWGQFKPGAYSKLKSTSITDAGGMKIKNVTTTKFTLKELSPTEATVTTESESVTDMNGTETKTPPTTSEMKVPLAGAPTATPSVPAEVSQAIGEVKAEAKTSTSSETLTIAGKEIKCTVSSSEVDAAGTKTVTKQWVSDDVPGAIVKSEATSTGPAATTMTMELLEFDPKK